MDALDRSVSIAVHPSARATVDFGPFRFDTRDHLLYRDGRQIGLPPRALAVLACLLERPNQVVTKRALMDAVWKDTFVEEASLKEAISLIRQALEEDAQQPRFIQTIHRRGYRFVAPVALSAVPAAEPRRFSPATAPPALRRAPLTWLALAAVLLAAVLWTVQKPRADAIGRTVRFAIPLGAAPNAIGDEDPRVAVSPDGARLVFVGARDGIDRLYERRLDRFGAREIPGTEDATAPFVSPDGQWIGFFADDHVKKVSVAGGAPLTVCDVPAKIAGGTWVGNETIVFGSETGLYRVAASGGTPSSLTHVDATRGEIGHWWPHQIGDRDAVLFTIWKTGLDKAALAVASGRSGQSHIVYEGGADGRYLSSGHLLFARSGGAATIPFDANSLRVAGSPTALALDAALAPFDGVLQVAVSDEGSLVYVPGSAETPELRPAWVDSNGTVMPLGLPPRPYRNLKLSPDGRRIAVTINEASDYDVWIADVERGTLTRLTFGGRNIEPVWSADGRSVIYASSSSSPFTLMRRRADGGGTAEQVLAGNRPYVPWSATADGQALMFSEMNAATGFDLWVLPTQAGGKPAPFLRSPFQEISAVFSPDGHAVAYLSNESGRYEVYVRRYPDAGGKWQVSAAGGSRPFWAADGRRLFYSQGDTLVAVDVVWGAEPAIGRPFPVVQRPHVEWFAAARDGRYLALQGDTRRAGDAQVNVVLNWLNSVRDSLGTAR